MKLDTGIILWINESCTLYICTHTICILLRTFLFIFLLFHFAFLSPSLFPSPTVILKLYDLFIMMPMMRIIDTDHRSINHYTSASRMSVSFLPSIYIFYYLYIYISIYLFIFNLSVYLSIIDIIAKQRRFQVDYLHTYLYIFSILLIFFPSYYVHIYLSVFHICGCWQ